MKEVLSLKLIVRGADYGMTTSITDGCLRAIREGILTDVGLMTNNHSAISAAEEIKKHPQISVGQDLNLVSGIPVTDPSLIQSLVNEEGRFYTSSERKNLNKLDISYDEIILEMDNQVKRFIELMGRKPSYLVGHSFSTPEIDEGIKAIREKYQVLENCFADSELYVGERWYFKNLKIKPNENKPRYDLEAQMNTNVEQFILEDCCQLLGHDYALLATHCGYCDGELLEMSSFSVIRGKELEALCSPKVKEWINKNKIELINYDQYIELRRE